MSDTFPPSPVPPWHRPPVAPVTHTLVEDGAISLNTNITYLNQTAPKDAEDETVPYIATIGAPLYPQQRKTIMIPATAVEDTAVWRVTGNFVGFVALKFDKFGQSVELMSGGDGYWMVLGGNATKEDQ